jgi:hypothetical protein
MTDDNTTPYEVPETTPATEVVHERRSFDRRSAGITAGALLALVLAFLAGLAIGDHGHHGRGGDERFSQVRERGGMGFHGRGGPAGMPGGGPGMDGGPRGRGGPFGGRGGGRGHGGGVMGVVTQASSTELTVDPLRGGDDDASNDVTVKLGADTKVYSMGANGREDAKASDIAKGAMVGVRSGDAGSSSSSGSITASAVMILRAADA